MLRWSRRILSEESGINPRTIQRMTEAKGIPPSNARFLDAVQKAFERGNGDAYIEFTDDNGIRYVERTFDESDCRVDARD